MKLFLDANILVSVFNKEYPLFTYSSRVLSLADQKNFKLFTSPVCLAIAFYFAEKKSGAEVAKNKIQTLISKIDIAETGKDAVAKTVQNTKISDFEDGIEYYAALNAGCQCIVTEDIDDFYFAEMEVMRAEQFLEKYLIK